MKKYFLLSFFLMRFATSISMDQENEKEIQLRINGLKIAQQPGQTPPQSILIIKPKIPSCKIIKETSLRAKIDKLLSKSYLLRNADSTVDDCVQDVLLSLPVDEVFPKIYLEKKATSKRIEQQILQLAQQGAFKTLKIGKDVDSDKAIISSSSSSSNSPAYSPIHPSPEKNSSAASFPGSYETKRERAYKNAQSPIHSLPEKSSSSLEKLSSNESFFSLENEIQSSSENIFNATILSHEQIASILSSESDEQLVKLTNQMQNLLENDSHHEQFDRNHGMIFELEMDDVNND